MKNLISRRRRQVRAATMRWYYKRKAERAALGLTTRGTVRITELHQPPSPMHGRRRINWRERLYTARKNAAGLTKRGNLKFDLIRLTPLERLWRSERAQMHMPVSANWELPIGAGYES